MINPELVSVSKELTTQEEGAFPFLGFMLKLLGQPRREYDILMKKINSKP